MKLSAPIFHLKRKAKLLSREEQMPLHDALKRVAVEEGFNSWSLLVARQATPPISRLFAQLQPGDLLLLGARPGQGKTLMGVALAVEAMRDGCRSSFFSLESAATEIRDRFGVVGANFAQFGSLFALDCSDGISADYMIAKLLGAPRRMLVVVDYLQLLDQKRGNPDLAAQVGALKSFANDHGLIFVFISQVDRAYDPARRPCPDLRDVRLPNPLDLQLFNKTCFMHGGEMRIEAVG